jgi:hypothetical protein
MVGSFSGTAAPAMTLETKSPNADTQKLRRDQIIIVFILSGYKQTRPSFPAFSFDE